MSYTPSSRPTFGEPTHISYTAVIRHLWQFRWFIRLVPRAAPASVPILPAALGTDAGLIGAAVAIWQRVKEDEPG